MKIAGIVLAAGYGHLRKEGGGPISKVTELVGSVPMVLRCVRTLRSAGVDSVVVVVNPYNRDAVQIELVGYDIRYVVQPERFGTADAVVRATKALNEKHAVVMFGDMPLWRPNTIRTLLDTHRQEKPVITMVTIDLTKTHPSTVEHYGRVFFNSDGSITAITEPGNLSREEMESAMIANPSLYAFDLEWICKHVRQIPPDSGRDSFTPERHLPFLIPIAFRDERQVAQVPLTDAREALGVNSAKDLARACGLVGLLK